jgi:hypothetical protein
MRNQAATKKAAGETTQTLQREDGVEVKKRVADPAAKNIKRITGRMRLMLPNVEVLHAHRELH